MRKKFLVRFAVVLVLIISLSATVVAVGTTTDIKLTIGKKQAFINGQAKELLLAPTMEKGTTLVPVRFVTEALGCLVEWKDATQEIILTDADKTIKLKVGSKAAYINGKQYQLLLPPKVIKGTTLVPIRFISENFGAVVDYNDKTKEIKISRQLNLTDQPQQKPAPGFKLYENPDLGFSLEYPADWDYLEVTPGNELVHIINTSTGENVIALAMPHISGLDFADWIEQELTVLQDTFKDRGFAITDQFEFDNRDRAYFLQYQLNIDSEIILGNQLYYFGKNNRYVVTVTTNGGDLADENREKIAHIIAGFQELD